MNQLVIVNAEGAFWVLPPSDQKAKLLDAAEALRLAYPSFRFEVAPVMGWKESNG